MSKMVIIYKKNSESDYLEQNLKKKTVNSDSSTADVEDI
jgi:hypothetical protein